MAENDNVFEISVSDNGIGIPEEKQEVIFETFRQADSSTSKQYGGTGLGLALVRKYVEMHGGNIWVDSEEGVGSTFTFTIPSGSGLK
ncbi:ATP-binding protein [Methanococcoides sp. LMO-2]|uniref:histidine kinase n=1 Tax=Methanococcoides cohabitans TaxID=3136559 RepID=A0ABU9KQ19_9EURY